MQWFFALDGSTTIYMQHIRSAIYAHFFLIIIIHPKYFPEYYKLLWVCSLNLYILACYDESIV
jgi:hypothetical protein